MSVITHVRSTEDCQAPDNAARYRAWLARRPVQIGNDYPWPHLDPKRIERRRALRMRTAGSAR